MVFTGILMVICFVRFASGDKPLEDSCKVDSECAHHVCRHCEIKHNAEYGNCNCVVKPGDTTPSSTPTTTPNSTPTTKPTTTPTTTPTSMPSTTPVTTEPQIEMDISSMAYILENWKSPQFCCIDMAAMASPDGVEDIYMLAMAAMASPDGVVDIYGASMASMAPPDGVEDIYFGFGADSGGFWASAAQRANYRDSMMARAIMLGIPSPGGVADIYSADNMAFASAADLRAAMIARAAMLGIPSPDGVADIYNAAMANDKYRAAVMAANSAMLGIPSAAGVADIYGLNGNGLTSLQRALALTPLDNTSISALNITEANVNSTIWNNGLNQNLSKSAMTIDQLKVMYSDLLRGNYNGVRPIVDQKKTVMVVTTFVPLSVIAVDAHVQRFEIMGYFIIQWRDELLQWNPANYFGASKIFIPKRDIWTPRLIIAKAHDGKKIIGDSSDIALVRSTGVVKWVPDGNKAIVCELNIQFYPYDVQNCTITYFVADETLPSVVLMYVGQSSLKEYTENPEWNLLEHTTETRREKNNNYIDLKFKLARRGGFAIFTLIIPLLMLSFLNGMVFLVPIDTGEKISFAISIFLSYGIFITIVIDTLPHNSLNVPYLLIYVISLLILSAILVCYAVIQSKIIENIGRKPCTLANITLCRQLKLSEEDVDKIEADNMSSVRTWAMLMVQLDTFMFFVFFSVIAADTTLFIRAIVKNVHPFDFI